MLNYLSLSIKTTCFNGNASRLICPFGIRNTKRQNHKLLFQQVLSTNLSCTKRNLKNESLVENDALYKEIYRFPAIKVGYTLHKLKWYQTLLTAAAVPISGMLYVGGFIEPVWIFNVIFSGVLVTLNLYGYAMLFNRAIGFIYLNKDETTVKIAYLDYWGKRVDMEIPVEEVVPLSESPRPLNGMVFKQIVFYSDDHLKLKLYLRHGKVTNEDGFDQVFGSREIG
ncbi:transmembrane protein 186 [Homalodisca vitripennis]|uniref:transmembrane protein 186 n=1 Tax=Homalodisca vitripennis TaxID=197043 RepID=UPI001EECC807|nr:transmembrane protein 186 [Homalodisca vitripennis]